MPEASKIVNIPMGIITAFGTVMLPRMSNIVAKGDSEKTEQYIRISIKLVTILCSAIAFGLMGISEVLAPVYLGEDFSACSSVIKLLSITVFFIAWANVVRTQYLIPCHYDRVYIFSTAVGALLNLFINYMLIPKLQSNGAAIGTIVAEFSVMFVQMFAVRKTLPVWKYIVQYTPVLFIGILMMFVVQNVGSIMGNTVLTLIVQVGVGGVIFCSLMLLYFMISKDELYGLVKDMLCKIVKR